MINITGVKSAESGAKKYFLFYSLTQFASWLVTILTLILLFNEVLQLVDEKQTLSKMSIVFGILCTLPSVLLAQQASFRIEGAWRVQALAMLQGRLDASKFRKVIVTPRETQYLQNLPKALQWEKSHLTILNQDDCVLVIGPIGALWGLRRFLLEVFSQK